MPSLRAALVGFFIILVGASAPAAAQELTGTFIAYGAVGPVGTLINGTHSMQYSETGAAPVEEFAIEGTSTAAFIARSTAPFATLSGPTVAGRTIRWTGRYASGTTMINVDQTFGYAIGDRVATLTVTLSNTGTATVRDM